MNILVTGANGQLGHEMQRVAENSNDTFVFTDVADGYDKLDITNLEAIRQMVKEKSIDIIVNCAAYTNVDKAETDFDLAATHRAVKTGPPTRWACMARPSWPARRASRQQAADTSSYAQHGSTRSGAKTLSRPCRRSPLHTTP